MFRKTRSFADLILLQTSKTPYATQAMPSFVGANRALGNPSDPANPMGVCLSTVQASPSCHQLAAELVKAIANGHAGRATSSCCTTISMFILQLIHSAQGFYRRSLILFLSIPGPTISVLLPSIWQNLQRHDATATTSQAEAQGQLQ